MFFWGLKKIQCTKGSNMVLLIDECHESYINLDIKQFVKRPNAEYLNRSAIYLPHQASRLQNLHSMTIPPLIELKDSDNDTSNYKLDDTICMKYLTKIETSQCFLHTNKNRGLFQLFSNVQGEGSIYEDMNTFYQVGQHALNDYVSHRLMMIPSASAPVKRKQLHTFV